MISEVNAGNYGDFIKYLQTEITLFNRKRSGEVTRIKLDDLKFPEKPIDNIIRQSLSTVEQRLCDIMKRIEVKGKRNPVAILFTKHMKSCIDLLLAIRKEMNITGMYLLTACW